MAERRRRRLTLGDPAGGDGPAGSAELSLESLLESSDEQRFARFVDRVAMLSAEDWGRLDASCAHLDPRDPIGRWRWTRHRAAILHVIPALEVVATAFFAATGAAQLAGDALLGWTRAPRPLRWQLPAPPTDHPSPHYAALFARLAPLRRAIEAQPGREDALSSTILQFAGLAILVGRLRDPDAIRRIYEPIEPVIPYASL